MNNRYTFKAKRKDNKEWAFGYYYVSTSYRKNIEHIMVKNIGFEIIPETLCQCTGLKDRDGNDIFENDIVNIHNNPYHGEAVIKYGIYKTKPFKKGQTEVEHLGFYLEIGNELLPLADIFTPIKSSLESTESIKIIGNKFDKEVE